MNPEDKIRLNLLATSRWIDANSDLTGTAHTWSRVAKPAEEAGEAIAAYMNAIGCNARKGRIHDIDDVIYELLDTAMAALGAVEHLTGHEGTSLQRLADHTQTVATRIPDWENYVDEYGYA